MKHLFWRRLHVISSSTRMANRFEFKKNLNLITAKDNSVGKSTLVKLLFWAFGCEPFLDSSWKSLDVKTLLEFEIEETSCWISRNGNRMVLKVGEKSAEEYEKVRGPFSERLSELLGFSPLLLNTNLSTLETPPPSYYFIPFYIDQKKSWTKEWDNFDKLGQYSRWQDPIMKFHIGLKTIEHFEIEKEKNENTNSQKRYQEEIARYQSAQEVLSTVAQQSKFNFEEIVDFEKPAEEIAEEFSRLQAAEEQALLQRSELRSDRVFLSQQLGIVESLIDEVELDYQFAVENAPPDQIVCPLCATVHDNGAISKASILGDKAELERQAVMLREKLEVVDESIKGTQLAISNATQAFNDLRMKYLISQDGETKSALPTVIETVAFNQIDHRIVGLRVDSVKAIDDLTTQLKTIKKRLNEINKRVPKDKILGFFTSTFRRLIESLDVEGVSLEKIKSPLNLRALLNEGGAADNMRAVLAFYTAVYLTICEFGTEVIAPFVVDTPKQQEQSKSNYSKVVSLFNDQLRGRQVFLCAMWGDQLDALVEPNIIQLDDNKLLRKDTYDVEKAFFSDLLPSFSVET